MRPRRRPGRALTWPKANAESKIASDKELQAQEKAGQVTAAEPEPGTPERDSSAMEVWRGCQSPHIQTEVSRSPVVDATPRRANIRRIDGPLHPRTVGRTCRRLRLWREEQCDLN